MARPIKAALRDVSVGIRIAKLKPSPTKPPAPPYPTALLPLLSVGTNFWPKDGANLLPGRGEWRQKSSFLVQRGEGRQWSMVTIGETIFLPRYHLVIRTEPAGQ